jgi:glycerol kinase
MPSRPSATCVLALDQGTTSSRAILFDRRGTPIAVAQEEFPQHARSEAGPDGADLGIVEHDPEDIWQTQLSCARRVLESAGVAADRSMFQRFLALFMQALESQAIQAVNPD